MVKSLVWIDVGTHAGQELMSIQASDFSFYRKVMRHEAKALIKRARSYSWADLGELARCRHWLRNHRSAMQVVLVEANPKLIGLPVYQTADRVVCAALGGRDDPTLSLGRLYLTGDDACGQGMMARSGEMDPKTGDIEHRCLICDHKQTFQWREYPRIEHIGLDEQI